MEEEKLSRKILRKLSHIKIMLFAPIQMLWVNRRKEVTLKINPLLLWAILLSNLLLVVFSIATILYERHHTEIIRYQISDLYELVKELMNRG